jgi:hypothetical protein
MRRTLSATALAAFVMLVNAATALASGHDPTKIGDNFKDVIAPNAKSFWWIAALGAAFAVIVARKTSRAGGVMIGLVLIGILIWNPLGVQEMMDSLSKKLI